jgi:5'-nucleotidase (lipoprotein e(P4) family)
VPLSVHWVRNAIEYRALALQVYRHATEQVSRLAATLPAGSWAVILDADETVLDNSEYQRRLAVRELRFDTTTWYAWAREQAAPAVPGAAEFTQEVRRLGGRVAIVSNRDQVICPPTEANLEAAGIAVDIVLCRQAESDKIPRYQAVANGTTPAGLPPLRVIAWVGDNIRDFPGLDQPSPSSELARFGVSYFMLPNPMYGSWESLPRR